MSHEARTQILTEGAKALLLINGGGIVALLGVLTQFFPPENEAERFFAAAMLCAMASLAFGLMMAAANYYFRFWSSSYWDHGEKNKHQRMYRLEKYSVILSFVFFIVGVLGIVISLLWYLFQP